MGFLVLPWGIDPPSTPVQVVLERMISLLSPEMGT